MLALLAFTCLRPVCILIGSHEMPLEPTPFLTRQGYPGADNKGLGLPTQKGPGNSETIMAWRLGTPGCELSNKLKLLLRIRAVNSEPIT